MSTPYTPSMEIRKLTRTRYMTPAQSLGLVLVHLRSKGALVSLCLLFGITSSTCVIMLRYGRCILLKALKASGKAAIQLPSDDEMPGLMTAVTDRHNQLKRVWAVIDVARHAVIPVGKQLLPLFLKYRLFPSCLDETY